MVQRKVGFPSIVLVRPRNPVNIGAAARAMANFGFEDLVVVDPHPPVWEEARRAGPGAERVLAAARLVPALADALADRTLVAGTTAGTRRKLDRELVAPSELRPASRTALVFGPEKTGLTNEELSFCHLLVRIPTVPDVPSMNLAQAVAVCCYEVSRKWGRHSQMRSAECGMRSADFSDVLRLLDHAAPLLEAAGFFDARTRAARLRKLRQILLRARLSEKEVALVTAALRQLAYKIR